MPGWPITWGEFKAAVEALGVSDGDQIDFIDCTPDGPETIRVNRESDENPKLFSVSAH